MTGGEGRSPEAPKLTEDVREFVRWIIRTNCWGDLDGGDVQERAEAAGIIEEVVYNEPCGESCRCAEMVGREGFPITCFHFTPDFSARLGETPKP